MKLGDSIEIVVNGKSFTGKINAISKEAMMIALATGNIMLRVTEDGNEPIVYEFKETDEEGRERIED